MSSPSNMSHGNVPNNMTGNMPGNMPVEMEGVQYMPGNSPVNPSVHTPGLCNGKSFPSSLGTWLLQYPTPTVKAVSERLVENLYPIHARYPMPTELMYLRPNQTQSIPNIHIVNLHSVASVTPATDPIVQTLLLLLLRNMVGMWRSVIATSRQNGRLSQLR
jgi:hypothetical protein